MGKKQSKPSGIQPPYETLGRMRDEVLKLRREVEAEQARADAIAAQQGDYLSHVK